MASDSKTKTGNVTLSQLPTEIFHNIIGYIDQADLILLCLVSKGTRELTLPALYTSITIHGDENDLTEIDVRSVLEASSQLDLLQHTKHLKFRSTFSGDPDTRARCPHFFGRDEDGPVDENGNHAMTLDCWNYFSSQTLRVLEACKNERLRSFSWDLGACIPPAVLGPKGILQGRQQNIESICLTTNPLCSGFEFHNWDLRLSSFRNLKSLSWKGLGSKSELGTLRHALEELQTQLVDLELDFLNWEEFKYGVLWTPEWHDTTNHPDLVTTEILPISQDSTATAFPALRRLSLSELSFENEAAMKNIANAIDFSLIEELSLLNCLGWQQLLIQVCELHQINLKSLNIKQHGIWDQDTADPASTISTVLDHFTSLRELTLSIPTPSYGTLKIWRSILHHRATMRRLVHHERAETWDDALNISETFDNLKMDLKSYNILQLQDQSNNPLASLDLEFLGLSCKFSILKTLVSPYRHKQCLKILHARQTGTDLEDYPGQPNIGLKKVRNDSDARIAASEVELDETSPTSENEASQHTNSPVLDSWESDNSPHSPDSENDQSSSEDEESDQDSQDEHGNIQIQRKLKHFANWAFGPDGIPSLRIIAVGDFTHSERHWDTNVVLCKRISRAGKMSILRVQTISKLKKFDRALWELAEEYRRNFEACPTGRLIPE